MLSPVKSHSSGGKSKGVDVKEVWEFGLVGGVWFREWESMEVWEKVVE